MQVLAEILAKRAEAEEMVGARTADMAVAGMAVDMVTVRVAEAGMETGLATVCVAAPADAVETR